MTAVDASEVTASAFSRPESTWGLSAVMLSMIKGTWPLITSGSAVAEPL